MENLEPGIKKYEKDGRQYFQVDAKVQKNKRVKTGRRMNILTIAEARRVRRKLTKELEEILECELTRGLTWGELVDLWIESRSLGNNEFTENLLEKTFEGYVSNLRNYTSQWNALSEKEISKHQVKKLFREIDERASFALRKKVRAAIEHVFEWAIDQELIPPRQVLPTHGYKPRVGRANEKLPEILTKEEIRKFLILAKSEDSEWYPIWAMALLTGMRSGELFALKWTSIDFELEQIFVHENWTKRDGYHPTKGRNWRTVPMSSEVKNLLLNLKATSCSDFVLPHLGDWKLGIQAKPLRAFLAGYGLPSVRFHTLRACFATHLIASGVAPATVMKIGGWKKSDTMDRYIRLAGVDVKGATDALRLLPEPEVMAEVVDLFEANNR